MIIKSLQSTTIAPVNSVIAHTHRHFPTNIKLIKTYRAAHPLCELCESLGKYNPTQEIHHMIDILDGGSSQHNNLLALCRNCHNYIHDNNTPSSEQLQYKQSSKEK